MDLLERYLAAVRRNLPARDAADITAELREELLQRAEERGGGEEQADWTAILKEFGHPLVVAARYRQRQSLIGPGVYPFYMSVLRIVLLVVGAVCVVGAVAALALGDASFGEAITQLVGNLFLWGLIAMGSVTFIFATLERRGFAEQQCRNWRPDQLPEPLDAQPGPWKSAMEVALSIAFLLWWAGVVRLPFPPAGEFRMVAAPVWTLLYWPIFILAAARLVHNMIQWLRPRWKTALLVLGAATAVGALAVLPVLYHAGEWITVVPTGMPADQAAQLQASLNLALRIAIIAVGVIWLIASLGTVWKFVRSAREKAVWA